MTKNPILEFIDYWLAMVEMDRKKVFERLVSTRQMRLVAIEPPKQEFPPRYWKFRKPKQGPIIIGMEG